MRNKAILFLLVIFPLALFAGEKKLQRKNIDKVIIDANDCYLVITTDKNPYPVSVRYTFPEKLVKIKGEGDSLNINVGKVAINDSNNVLSVNINKHIIKSDTVYINLCPYKNCDLGIELGAVNANITFGESKFKNIFIKSGVSDIKIDFSHAKRLNLNKIDITSGVSKLNIKNLVNSRADTINISGGISKYIIGISGKLKNKMSININTGLSLGTFIVDDKLPIKIECSDTAISLKTIPEDFELIGDGIYTNRKSYKGPYINLKIGNAIGTVDILEK